MADRSTFSLAGLVFSLLVYGGIGQAVVNGGEASSSSSTSSTSSSSSNSHDDDDGLKVVCYYTPTSYFLPSRVPSGACTHLIYAFGSLSSGSSGPNITPPSQGQASAWVTLTALRRQNPQLKVLLSLQQGFSSVVGPDTGKMQQFAVNSVAYLRKYQFDGVDMDWEFPSSSQRNFYAQFFTIMRTAIDKEARATGKPALLLSLAMPNSYSVAQKSYDIPTIGSAVDFGTAMTYDFHVYNQVDKTTGYNSPLFTPPGEYKYFSASAMVQYYLSHGMPAKKLLMGISTYGRSWQLASSSNHGLHAPAVGKGPPGPYRHFPGVYTYPDACTALKQGSTSVPDKTLGAVYLYKDTTWVAYDDTSTVTAKSEWAMNTGLGGMGVWALHLDDIDGVCGEGPLPLIAAMKGTVQRRAERQPHSLLSGWDGLHTSDTEDVISIESLDVNTDKRKVGGPMATKKTRMHTSRSEPALRRHHWNDAVYSMGNPEVEAGDGAPAAGGPAYEERDPSNVSEGDASPSVSAALTSASKRLFGAFMRLVMGVDNKRNF